MRTGPKTERLKILSAATHETELGDHDSCLSRSHDSEAAKYTVTSGFKIDFVADDVGKRLLGYSVAQKFRD